MFIEKFLQLTTLVKQSQIRTQEEQDYPPEYVIIKTFTAIHESRIKLTW